jgi:hypothetical protein
MALRVSLEKAGYLAVSERPFPEVVDLHDFFGVRHDFDNQPVVTRLKTHPGDATQNRIAWLQDFSSRGLPQSLITEFRSIPSTGTLARSDSATSFGVARSGVVVSTWNSSVPRFTLGNHGDGLPAELREKYGHAPGGKLKSFPGRIGRWLAPRPYSFTATPSAAAIENDIVLKSVSPWLCSDLFPTAITRFDAKPDHGVPVHSGNWPLVARAGPFEIWHGMCGSFYLLVAAQKQSATICPPSSPN